MEYTILDDIENRFTFHPARGNKSKRHEDIRDRCKQLAIYIAENTSYCREQSMAISKLDEAMMWANAAIARQD